jgi:hypothetical protein
LADESRKLQPITVTKQIVKAISSARRPLLMFTVRDNLSI